MKQLLELIDKNSELTVVFIAILVFLLIFVGVKRVSDTKALYLQGKKKRIVTGRTAYYLRFFTKTSILDLSLMSSEIKMDEYAQTIDFINIKLDSLVKYKLSSETEQLFKATKLFLDKSEEEIKESVEQIIKTSLIEIISQFSVKKILQNKKEFNLTAINTIKKILFPLGIDLIYFSVFRIIDEKGIISNLESETSAKILQVTRIERAMAEKNTKDTEIRLAQEIYEKTNQMEMRKAELKKEVDIKRATADTVYEIEKQKKLKELEELTELVNTLKENNKEKLAKMKISTATSEFEQEKHFAEINMYKKQKEAEARKLEVENEINTMKMKTLAQVENDRIMTEAEAEKLKLKTETEIEVINKRAETMKKYGANSYVDTFKVLNSGLESIEYDDNKVSNNSENNNNNNQNNNNINNVNNYNDYNDIYMNDEDEYV